MAADKSDVEYEDDIPNIPYEGMPFEIVIVLLIAAVVGWWFIKPAQYAELQKCEANNPLISCSVGDGYITLMGESGSSIRINLTFARQ